MPVHVTNHNEGLGNPISNISSVVASLIWCFLPTSTVQKNWAAPLRFRMYTEFRAWAMDNELKQHLVWVCHGLSTYLSIYLLLHLSIHPSTYLSTSIYHYLLNSLFPKRKMFKQKQHAHKIHTLSDVITGFVLPVKHITTKHNKHIYNHIYNFMKASLWSSKNCFIGFHAGKCFSRATRKQIKHIQ